MPLYFIFQMCCHYYCCWCCYVTFYAHLASQCTYSFRLHRSLIHPNTHRICPDDSVHIKFVSHFNISASFCRLFYSYLFLHSFFCTLSTPPPHSLLMLCCCFFVVVAVIWLPACLCFAFIVADSSGSFFFLNPFRRSTMMRNGRWEMSLFLQRMWRTKSLSHHKDKQSKDRKN